MVGRVNNSHKLLTLLELARNLQKVAKESNYEQGDILSHQYQKLYCELISIDPDAKLLPHDDPRGPGMFMMNLEDERKKAIIGSSQMVGYIETKLSFQQPYNASAKEILLDESKPFDAYRLLIDIFKTARNEIAIIDPYVDDSLFTLYFNELPREVTFRLLTKNMYDKFELVAKKYKKQYVNFEVRKFDKIHDRYLVIDSRGWIIGQSLKDAGDKPLSVVELEDVEQIKEAFSSLWLKGKKVV
jgi:hypothetical protein